MFHEGIRFPQKTHWLLVKCWSRSLCDEVLVPKKYFFFPPPPGGGGGFSRLVDRADKLGLGVGCTASCTLFSVFQLPSTASLGKKLVLRFISFWGFLVYQNYTSIKSFPRSTACEIQDCLVDVETISISSSIWTLHVNAWCADITTCCCAWAGNCCDLWLVSRACRSLKVLENDVVDCQWGWVLETESQVLLSVTLVNLDGVVNLPHSHGIKSDVADSTRPPTTLEISREGARDVGPNLDAGGILK